MEPKVEQWMQDAAKLIVNDLPLPYRYKFEECVAIRIAQCAPQPFPDICEKCGQEVVDGHFSLVCHKPSCLAALAEPIES